MPTGFYAPFSNCFFVTDLVRMHSGLDRRRRGLLREHRVMFLQRARDVLPPRYLRLLRAAAHFCGRVQTAQFEKLVVALALPPRPRVLDVGAGGFLGTNTTAHLLKLPGATIDAIEISSDHALALAERFEGRLNVITGDFLQHPFAQRYDLIVLDLDSPLIPALYNEWIPGKVKQLLTRGGAVIALCFGYAPETQIDSYGLAPETQILARKFLMRKFGATVLTPAILEDAYRQDADYEFVAMRGKLGAVPPETIVWIGLRRRQADT